MKKSISCREIDFFSALLHQAFLVTLAVKYGIIIHVNIVYLTARKEDLCETIKQNDGLLFEFQFIDRTNYSIKKIYSQLVDKPYCRMNICDLTSVLYIFFC